MSEHERHLRQTPQSEDELEAQLSRLGPLMAQQERFEAELDPVFAARLRAHLLDDEELTPHPTFARNLRSRLLRRSGTRPVHQPGRKLPLRSVGISALASAALLIAVVIRVLNGSNPPAPSFVAPYPQRADLVFSFPTLPVVIHRLVPTLSLVHPAPGVPYAGHLHLTAPALPPAASSLPAYQLGLPSGVMIRGRRLLRISSAVERVRSDATVWLIAADGGAATHQPLHSLAISTRTGELIYHDRRNHLLPRASHPLNQQPAVAIAQQWLARLGWPGHRMPLRSFHPVPGRSKLRTIMLGWPHVGATATDAATLWITPNGSVIEGWVWPPIVRHGLVPARSITNAWQQVHGGTLPLAVERISPLSQAGGIGTLHRTDIVSILTTGKAGKLYLVPTYRFQGVARIVGAGRHVWYSLAPSMNR